MKGDDNKLGVRVCAVLLGISSAALMQCSSDSRTLGGGAGGAGVAQERPVAAAATVDTGPSLRVAYIESVQRDAGAQYAIAREGKLPVAVNTTQNFRASFHEGGIAFQGLQASRWNADMRVVGIGHGGIVHPLGKPTMHTDKNRVEYRHGDVTEWYVNGPLGLEQGFTIAKAPEAPKAPGVRDLSVDVQIASDLKPVVTGKDTIDFKSAKGATAFRVSDVYAKDATGRALPASIRLEAGRLRMHVDDAGATYPVVIDPLYTQEATLTASDAATSNYFGFSSAVVGTTAFVGARGAGGTGAVYVFNRFGTNWTQTQKLVGSDTLAGDQFGSSLSVSGDTLAIGARGRSSFTGAGYIYRNNGGTWVQQAKLVALDGQPNDFFGASIAVSGSTAVVGSSLKGGRQGYAYVFVRTGTAWDQTALLTGIDSILNDQFGTSVAVDETSGTIAVGAVGASSKAGSAYVFTGAGATWNEQAKLTASDTAANDFFGNAIAVSGDTVVVGASHKNNTVGEGYIFTRAGTAWTQANALTITGGAVGDFFGWAVAIDSDNLVVSAVSTGGDKGAALQYSRSAGVWSEQGTFVASDGAASDAFGVSVAINGSTILVGASGKNSSTGAAYVFSAPNSVVTPTVSATCSTTPCDVNSTVTVSWTGLPGFARDYVSIAAQGSADSSITAFQYTNGATSGSLDFTNLPIGTFVARSFANDTFTKLAESAPFDVAPASTTAVVSIACSDSPCTADSTITLTYSGMPGYSDDYLAIAPQGSAPTDVFQFVYTGGATSGTIQFSSLPAGQTVVGRAFVHGTNTQIGVDSAPITIAGGAGFSLSARCAPNCTDAQSLIADFSGFPGLARDWIAVVQAGHPPEQYDRYLFTDGATEGFLDFGLLPAGTYYLEGFQNNTYTPVGTGPTATFTVASTTTPPTPTLAPTVTGAGAVSVDYTNMAGYKFDWLAVAPVGSADTAYVSYVYTYGAFSGTATFSGIAPGTYEIRAYFNNTFTREATSSSFVIP